MSPNQAGDGAIAAAAIVIATDGSPGNAPTLAEERWRGRSILAGIVARLTALTVVVVVVRDEEAVDMLEGSANAVAIVDPEWAEGHAAPLRAGLDYLTHSSDTPAAFVVTIDVPEVSATVLDELAIAFAAGETPVVVPKYRYVRGGPVLLGRDIWPRFLGAEGDLDLEDLLLAHPDWVTEVRVDAAPLRRIATRSDLVELTG